MIEKYINSGNEILSKYVILRYLISGGTAGLTLLALLYLFEDILGVHYLISSAVGFIGGVVVSFVLHKYWTFKSHGESTHKQAVMYLGNSLLGLGFNTLLMYIFVDHFHIQVILSQIVVGFLGASLTFFISHTFVFKYKKETIKTDFL